MSPLSTDFFAYVWVWHRLANRLRPDRRGMPGEKFSHSLLKLGSAKYKSAWPMSANRGYGEWAGCAWFRAAGLNELVQGDEKHDPAAVSDPAKYLFAADKNLVRTTSAFLAHHDFIALERQEITLYELLERERIANKVEEQFGLDLRTLSYKGPVVVGWRHYPKRVENNPVESDSLVGTRAKRTTEKIYWLGILPRHIVDLTRFGKKLRADPIGREMLLRGGFDVLIDLPDKSPTLPEAIRVDPRIAARALTLAAGGDLEQTSDYDVARNLDLGDGPHTYVFYYEKMLQPAFGRVLATMTPHDRLAWYQNAATRQATSMILNVAKRYAAPPLILVFSSDMAAAIIRELPWTWYQTPSDLRTIRATTKESRDAQTIMLILASALSGLCANQGVPASLLRQAWNTLDRTQPFDVTTEQLAQARLFNSSDTNVVGPFPTPINFRAFMEDDYLFKILGNVLGWLWSDADIDEKQRAWRLGLAIGQIKPYEPEWGEELYLKWIADFPLQPEVLFSVMWKTMEEGRWQDVADVIAKLVNLGEREKVDGYWEHFFPRIRGRVDELVSAGRVALESGTGVSHAIAALLPYYEQEKVAAFLHVALSEASKSLYWVLRGLADRDLELSRFVLDIAAHAPMDDMTREQFDAAVLRMRALEAGPTTTT